MFLSILLVGLVSSHLSTSVMSEVINTKNTTELIGCGGSSLENVNHTKQYYEVSPYSQLQLPSCYNEQSNVTTYWFTVKDLCKQNKTSTAFFAEVQPNGAYHCSTRPELSIPMSLCNSAYNFTKQSMIIKNMTQIDVSEYICILYNNQVGIYPTSAVSYSIEILDTPTSTAAVNFTTQFTTAEFITSSSIKTNFTSGTIPRDTSSGATSTTIGATPHASPNPSILPIVLPIIFGLLIIIILVALGLFYYRRRHRNHKMKSDDYSIDEVTSKTDPSPYDPYSAVYAMDVTKLNSDRGYAVWRPVQQKI